MNFSLQGRGFEIQFDGLRVYIRLDSLFVDKTRGLCGTYDFNSANDFVTLASIVEPDIKTFIDYYKVKTECTTPTQDNPCRLYANVCSFNKLLLISFVIINREKILHKHNVQFFVQVYSANVHQLLMSVDLLRSVNLIYVQTKMPIIKLYIVVRHLLPMHVNVV